MQYLSSQISNPTLLWSVLVIQEAYSVSGFNSEIFGCGNSLIQIYRILFCVSFLFNYLG